MKKLISLLLVLIMTLGMLSGLCFADYEKPEEVDAASAGVVVTHTGDRSAKYYFETLTNELVRWVCHDLEGNKTITLLKDLDLTCKEGASKFISIPSNMGDWHNRAGLSTKLTIDLDDNTINFSGSSSLIYMDRFGVTVKNGTINYNGISRHVFVLGGTKTATATSAGGLWTPDLTLDNVEIYAKNEQDGKPVGGAVIYTSQCGAGIEILDSLLYTASWTPIQVRKTTQANIKENYVPYTGEFETMIEIIGSTLISGDSYPVECSKDAPAEVIVEDSTLVSNHESGLWIAENTVAKVDTNEDPEKDTEWSQETPVGTLSGIAYNVGDTPEAVADIALPFFDVAETDWFYSYVKELYGKKIIAGQTAISFAPNKDLTYAAALKLLVVGLTGKDPGNASGHWAANYLVEAKAAGWTTIDTAKLDAPITREAFCEIAAKAKNLTAQPAMNPFTDTANASVLALVNAGVINGMSPDKFVPTGILTRAQISKIISGLLALK